MVWVCKYPFTAFPIALDPAPYALDPATFPLSKAIVPFRLTTGPYYSINPGAFYIRVYLISYIPLTKLQLIFIV